MSDRRRTVVLSSPRVEADVCVEHHHNADDLLREVAEFRRERGDESREVLLFVGVEAAGPSTRGVRSERVDRSSG